MKSIQSYNFELDALWTKDQFRTFQALDSPFKIQAYLDSLLYSEESKYRSPRSVLRDKKAHCFDGAIFAAAALRRLGYDPIIIDMIAHRDDDHIIAVYKRDGYLGSIAKSNFVGLRFREPIYKNIRELIMSYFDSYYNLDRQKSLRSYIGPLNLKMFDKYDWMSDDKGMEEIEKKLNKMKITKVLTPKMIKNLSPVDDRTFQAGMIGANMAGVYDPRKKE
jgi:hypothetical protein